MYFVSPLGDIYRTQSPARLTEVGWDPLHHEIKKTDAWLETNKFEEAQLVAARICMSQLLEHRCESKPLGFTKKNPYYEKGDEDASSMFSERFLYPLIGIEDARTVQAILRRLSIALSPMQ